MAKMVPGAGPRDFQPASREGELYRALSSLPDEYVVVHSMKMVTFSIDRLKECEADFVVFHPKLGIMCIEAKSGEARYENGIWKYGNGYRMKRGGPFNQAANAKYELIDLFESKGLTNLLRRCSVHSAVWFPSLDEDAFRSVQLPPEADTRLMLFKDDLENPEPRIRQIFLYKAVDIDTELSEFEAKRIFDNLLCPKFDLIPSNRLKYDIDEIRFIRLLESQKRILDFLADQRSAVINGVAGSGKTLIAVEYARRLSDRGERVLFLCYNSMLKEDIRNKCSEYREVDVYTISGYACKVIGNLDYDALNERLEEYFDSNSFPYQHVIVDEGQDFAVDAINQSEVLQSLSLLTEQNGGTFYLFYDRNQLVQGSGMPSFIEKADCKLTLYVNCRNTKNIALCSLAALGDNPRCVVQESAVSGSIPKLFNSTDAGEQAIFVFDSILELQEKSLHNICILTCSTEQKSILSDWVSDGCWKGTDIPFTTCRKFKGLEADAVILVDVDDSVWIEDKDALHNAADGLLFYVGASRAKHELRIVCSMDENVCCEILDFLGVKARRRPYRELAKKLNAKLLK